MFLEKDTDVEILKSVLSALSMQLVKQTYGTDRLLWFFW